MRVPPAPLGDGRGEVPGGDLGANGYVIELTTVRRVRGRALRMQRVLLMKPMRWPELLH